MNAWGHKGTAQILLHFDSARVEHFEEMDGWMDIGHMDRGDGV